MISDERSISAIVLEISGINAYARTGKGQIAFVDKRFIPNICIGDKIWFEPRAYRGGLKHFSIGGKYITLYAFNPQIDQ